ncbi:DUF2789 domain-containing protein [Roseateles sp.]|uniref:DUF2789 domain-containing protein n=1 Tax=Roseateles sp. TaxID=1971397 RepID=UPI002E04C60A|nr:DUF2789 domain-containing protein [Roseateles sp.]
MDTTTHHPLYELFTQLGLPDSEEDIRRFIREHRPLPQTLNLSEAPFWTPSQVAFLREQWHADDGDWVIQIDQLNAALREHPAPEDLQQGGGA